MRGNMKKMIFVLTLALLVSCMGYTFFMTDRVSEPEAGSGLVLLNEIARLTEPGTGAHPAGEQIEELRELLRMNEPAPRRGFVYRTGIVYGAFALACMLLVLACVYFKVLRPFHRLERYAGEIAKGNLDIELKYERTNFFGAFTWAFDHMRQEILRARRCEEQAVAENKTIIAAISHDIKTPIASIRAYAEGLEAGLAADFESRERYLSVIMKKCDEVTALTNDLVLHSLSELTKLEITCRGISAAEVLDGILKDLERDNVKVLRPLPEACVQADEKRLAQVMENLLNNAAKYAPGAPVEVWAELRDGQYEIHIRDHGEGVLPEDMPFLCDKFYRGKNAGQQPGSGLGLYIVSYIMERMGGGLRLVNHGDGLEALIWLLKTS